MLLCPQQGNLFVISQYSGQTRSADLDRGKSKAFNYVDLPATDLQNCGVRRIATSLTKVSVNLWYTVKKPFKIENSYSADDMPAHQSLS